MHRRRPLLNTPSAVHHALGCPPVPRLYDCDFNQQLELGLPRAALRTVFDVESLGQLAGG